MNITSTISPPKPMACIEMRYLTVIRSVTRVTTAIDTRYALNRLGTCILSRTNDVRLYISSAKVSSNTLSLRPRAWRLAMAPLAYRTIASAMGSNTLLATTSTSIILFTGSGMNESSVGEL